ncbi:MAG: RNA polymerase-associated protein rapA [Gammaproteobacteria bacterium]|nr:RNA polymerase-associated protein rapA [Gammaproteobacteria bacterium]
MAALATPVVFVAPAQAEWEFNGYVKTEVAATTESGEFIGARKSVNDTTAGHSGGDVFKSEVSARMFINGDIFEDSSLHADINLMGDLDANPNGYRSPKAYTQQDPLRELYIDTSVGDTYIRLGKQQVVWGTADGIKLLDIINPTDFREFVQNTMEDSRLPVWMANVDIPVGDRGSMQLILSEHEENKIPGLHESGDAGHPFIMKGVDSITGKVNGFYNIVPALAGVSGTFNQLAFQGGLNPARLTAFGHASVDGFSNNTGAAAGFAGACGGYGVGAGATTSSRCLDTIAQNGQSAALGGVAGVGANNNVTNLVDTHSATDTATGASASWNVGSANTTFEYMPNATFATFNTFAGATSEYVRDYPDEDRPNFGGRFKTSLDNGLNFSANYFYHYDSNPSVQIDWRDRTTGEKLTTEIRQRPGAGFVTGNVVSVDNIATTFNPALGETVLLKNSAGQYYGAVNPTTGATGDATHSTNGVVMRFTETVHRMHSLGGAFDYAFDAGDLPIVLRGEFLYDKNAHVPVVDRRALGIGDLEHGLQSEEADFFKYVIGVDVTVLTNLLVSGQFIQFRNLDYVDQNRTCTTESGSTFNCSKYTANPATLHLTNGMQQAEENQNFVSLFFSKPFGEAQLGRFNNITIWEDGRSGDGYWNRMDVEYSFSDNLVGTAEWNHYWGDENTMFGQFDKSSNFQIGVKYIF